VRGECPRSKSRAAQIAAFESDVVRLSARERDLEWPTWSPFAYQQLPAGRPSNACWVRGTRRYCGHHGRCVRGRIGPGCAVLLRALTGVGEDRALGASLLPAVDDERTI